MATAKAKKSTSGGGKGKKPGGESAGNGNGFNDNIRLANIGQELFVKAFGIGATALIISVVLGAGEHDAWKRFSHSYLTAFMWMLTIAAGSLWWVTLQNLVNANWSIVLRRVAELIASNILVVAILSLPVLLPAIMGNSVLYTWADPAQVQADHVLAHKAAYLNPTFFAIRFLFYFAFWGWLARYLLNSSLKQDQDKAGGKAAAEKMQVVAGPAMIVFGLTITFAAFDLVMSLDAKWFSTMFGIYYFASCVLAVNSILPLVFMWLQSRGRVATSVTVHHFHDLGKMMFAFTIFWAYIGFAQFMLIWYANIPEETLWFKHRFAGDWGCVSWVLLFGHFVIPFFGLLSRHVKRSRKALAFWAIWQLVMIYLDMYWLIMPELHTGGVVPFGIIDITTWLGVIALFVAGVAYRAKSIDLVATNDPRLPKSLAFENL
jgi:hypothetical protein